VEEIRDKFFRLGSKVLSDQKLNEIIDKVEGIEDEDDVGSIARMMTADATS